MDSDQGKLFVGGISWETTEEKLKDYFKAYGEVAEAVIMKDRATGRARGFGFVVFTDPTVGDRVVQEKHTIDGRMVEAKKAVPRDEQQNVLRGNNGGPASGNQGRTKKIFVGGLASTVTENDFRKYFEQFGTITDVVVMYDHGTQRPRGFGFITYDSEDAVENVLQKTFHELNGKMVEVKRAIPKELSAGPTRSSSAVRGGFYGGGFAQSFNSSPGGTSGARMDIRYGPSPSARGGYPGYGGAVAGFGSSGGYGAPMNGTHGSGSYGTSAGYGASGSYSATSYGGSTMGGGYGGGAGGYGSSNAISGYGSAPGRNVWGTGGTSYGSGGGSTGYGGSGAAGMSGYTWGSTQNSGSSSGYGTSSYGYGSSDGGYNSNIAGHIGRSSGYGTSVGGYGLGGGGSGSGNYTAGYGDIYANSGFSDSTWRTNGIDLYNAGGASGGTRSGEYGLNSNSTSAVDGAANGSAVYGVGGRQSHRGVPV